MYGARFSKWKYKHWMDRQGWAKVGLPLWGHETEFILTLLFINYFLFSIRTAVNLLLPTPVFILKSICCFYLKFKLNWACCILPGNPKVVDSMYVESLNMYLHKKFLFSSFETLIPQIESIMIQGTELNSNSTMAPTSWITLYKLFLWTSVCPLNIMILFALHSLQSW